MTPQRAKEIIDQTPRDPFGAKTELRQHMNYDEIQQVNAVWETLPGSTSFNDAIRYIATARFLR